MKKTTLLSLVFTLLALQTFYAQYTENFEDDFSTSGWNLFDTEGSPIYDNFTRGDVSVVDTYPSRGMSLAHLAVDYPGGTMTSWIVSPQVIVNGSIDLSFFHLQDFQGFGAPPEDCAVYYSKNSSDPITNPSDFVEINDLYADANEGFWKEFMVDLKTVGVLDGDAIFIAFSYTGDFSHRLFIDDLTISGATLSADRSAITKSIEVYPTVANNTFTVKALESINNVQVFNLLGRQIMNEQPTSKETHIDISNLSTGIYIVKVQIGDTIGSYRIVKQ
ncbi:hypothetical protein KH5_22560 [Urechidicola sp. KH5]